MAYKLLPSRDAADSFGSSAKRWLKGWLLRMQVTEYVDVVEMTAPAAPATNVGRLYVADAAGTTTLYFKDSAGVTTTLGAAGAQNTLDASYDQGGAGVGRTITVDQGAVQLNGSHATNDTLFINKTAGSGDAVQITNAGTGKDVAGTSGTWEVSKAGAAVFSSLAGVATLNADGANLVVGAPAATVEVKSATWDISAAGAISGVTSLSLSDDISLANGKAVKSSTTTAETMKLQGYDVNNTTYRDALTITNGDVIAIAVGTGNETVSIASTTWDVSAAGAFSGVTGLAFAAGEAATVSLASNGAADDMTLQLTGANDASIILDSAGTGEDAIKIASSAGGVDVDAAAAKDLNLAGGQVAIVSKDNAASAISLTANIGVTETIVVTNTQGTSESAITLTATAGGVNVDAAAAKDLDLAGGQVKLVSKDDAAGAISLTANIGTSETILVTNTQGTDEASINLTATAGGVNIDAAAAKNVAIDGGQVLIGSKDNAASAIALTTNVGTTETIVVTNTQGTDAAAIKLLATAGGITLQTAAGKTITANGTLTRKVGSNVASPAGGELDLGDGDIFFITGTNNITSIAAADTWAGREIFLVFEGILTFTDGNNLKIAGNLVTSADDTIALVCYDGTNWHEKCRSVN